MKAFVKRMVMFFCFVLIVPAVIGMNISAVQAATTPYFSKTKVTIAGKGETYQLVIKSKVAKSTYKWSSSDKTVATVTKNGVVTSINKGTATIKCKITYPSKKTKTLSCKVTVTIPATDVEISNTTLTNGAQRITLGSSMDFDCTLTPSNSSDQVYWSIGKEGDPDCIRIDDAAAGKITALKAGKVTLRVAAVATATKEAAATSIVDDSVIIEVVGQTATVNNVDIKDSNTIVAVFDSPILESTVIGSNGLLSSNIEITLRKDTKGVLGNDPGTLKASLSTDKKTLTITTANAMNGNYGINFTSNIKTTDNIALESYYKAMTYSDGTGPYIVQTTVDDSGLVATIQFNEVVNFDSLKVSGAALVNSSVAADASTLSLLNNKLNYIISDDKKSLSINLSGMVTTDRGKLFSVYISGIKDTAGNIPSTVYVTAYIQTDTSAKPQARVLSLQRTAYNTITATFDRSIQTPGYITVNGGSWILGSIDSTNTKKVNYTLTATELAYTGVKTVQIGHWNSYNVIATDTSSSIMQSYMVDFTADTVPPTITQYTYDADTNIMTLTFSESVSLVNTTGIFTAKYVSSTDEISPNTNVSYTQVTHTLGNNIIQLKLSNISLLGTYTFTLNSSLVYDTYRNANIARDITINNTSSTSAELPAPYRVYQSTTNPDQVIVEFANKLDKTSAETISNYVITGVSIIKAELTKNTSDTGATVTLTMASDSVAVTVARPVVISGVKGYNNSYGAIAGYSTSLEIKENKKPSYAGISFDTSTKNTIKINFDEAIQGTMVVQVTQISGSYSSVISNTVSISGNTVNITLSSIVPTGSYLKVDILTNSITDLAGNASRAMASTLGVATSY